MEKLHIARPIVVEGKYDKIALSAVLDAHIFATGGFSVFNNKELVALLRRLGQAHGILVLTDSDGGGRQIRSFLRGVLPPDKVIHLYIPAIPGKEKRKTKAGKAGLLGVEGMSADLLRDLFLPYAAQTPIKRGSLTKARLYEDGLSGREDSAQKRKALCLRLGLPPDMTANALLEALNLLVDQEEYRKHIEAIHNA